MISATSTVASTIQRHRYDVLLAAVESAVPPAPAEPAAAEVGLVGAEAGALEADAVDPVEVEVCVAAAVGSGGVVVVEVLIGGSVVRTAFVDEHCSTHERCSCQVRCSLQWWS
jgi:hypothetical protein